MNDLYVATCRLKAVEDKWENVGQTLVQKAVVRFRSSVRTGLTVENQEEVDVKSFCRTFACKVMQRDMLVYQFCRSTCLSVGSFYIECCLRMSTRLRYRPICTEVPELYCLFVYYGICSAFLFRIMHAVIVMYYVCQS